MNNIIFLDDLRRPAPAKTGSVYVRITEQDVVDYGLRDVSEDDVPRLIKALLLLGSCLMEIRHE